MIQMTNEIEKLIVDAYNEKQNTNEISTNTIDAINVALIELLF
jgi:hypothetical protein